MMRSMFSGVSGLRVHQTRMDVIGNNIANVNTIGYKSQRVTFNEVFSQTLQSASSASDETGRGGLNPMQVGLGVNISSIDMLMTQGAAQRTDNPFDLMINGEGFIVVGDATGKYFTRAGALRQDDNGNLIIPNGMKVMGWPATASGKDVERKEVVPLKLNDPTFKTTPPEATTAARMIGNLNTDDGLKGVTTQIKMYDTLGNYYSLNMQFKYTAGTATPAADASWSLGAIADPNDATKVIIKDQNGKEYRTDITKIPTTTMTFTSSGELKPSGTPAVTSFTIGGFDVSDTGAKVGPVVVDFTNITQYAAKQSVECKTGDKDGVGAGKAAGKMVGYAVGPDGKITASYDNSDQRILGQVVVAQFDNPAGLEKIGDNLYKSTANSGDFDNIGKVGTFQAGVLEMSNVDLSKEFTDMIVTQRGFQANSRIITVSDEMLQELTNLKR